MFTWFIIVLAAIALLLATWFAAEWVCRRIAASYARRKRVMRGYEPDEE